MAHVCFRKRVVSGSVTCEVLQWYGVPTECYMCVSMLDVSLQPIQDIDVTFPAHDNTKGFGAAYGGFPKVGVPFWCPHNKDYCIWRSIFGSPYLEKFLYRVSNEYRRAAKINMFALITSLLRHLSDLWEQTFGFSRSW